MKNLSKTVALSTMGCRANQYDSAAMSGLLAKSGWKLVSFDDPADAYIINTCTVTNKADAEARSLARKAHRQNPESTILVTGCYAQTDPWSLASIEGVSFVLGNDQKGSIVDYLSRVQPLQAEVIVNDLFKEEAIFTHDFDSFAERSRAYLKIQDGCNQMCSYCVIPFARGKNRSVHPDWVIAELKRLSEKGFDEAVLTGIHIGTYGYDLSPESSLLELMKSIEKERPIHRVRISSIDPEEVSDEMIDFLSNSKIFCPYLHIPIQSGNDHILKLMRRRYDVATFEKLCKKLKERIPSICLGTDVMVGFPYEDEQRFQESYDLIKRVPLDYLHVFPYSSKKKTRAATFLHQVSTPEKKRRVRQMTLLSQEKKDCFYFQSLGKVFEVIMEEEVCVDPPGYLKGMSENFLPIYLPFSETIQRQRLQVKVVRYDGGYLFGEIIQR
ncbi:MAG: tRNA (N(6)-L-threonylcarbamoyladenosine(37)-C(2))-methylthiotransferase MtaB [Deltaproteobacteria bacterium]|nr:tRNA (N(6)-L-threonylcarbamoyladenosine(37)-C(2))-methylthiotransferase MtaB [Deltaproteobacteria bacterium]